MQISKMTTIHTYLLGCTNVTTPQQRRFMSSVRLAQTGQQPVSTLRRLANHDMYQSAALEQTRMAHLTSYPA